MACPTNVTPEMLQEAQSDYHALLLGNKPRVVVDQSGERVEFTQANKADLYAYIQELQAALECAAGTPINNGPVGFVF